MECVRCICVWLGQRRRRVIERIWFGPNQFIGKRGSVERVYVFGLRWCRRGVGMDQGLEGWCYVCVSSNSLCIWQV